MGILDGILDQNLTEIADLPTYEIPPAGAYKFLVKSCEEKPGVEMKKGDTADVLSINYVVQEVVELADPLLADSLIDPVSGELKKIEFNESYFFRAADPKSLEMTKSALKATFAEVAEAWKLKTLKELIDRLPGAEIYCILKHRKDKNDETKVYAQVRNAKLA